MNLVLMMMLAAAHGRTVDQPAAIETPVDKPPVEQENSAGQPVPLPPEANEFIRGLILCCCFRTRTWTRTTGPYQTHSVGAECAD